MTLTEAQARQRGWNGVPNYPLDGGADEGWDYNPALSQDDMLDKIAAQKLAKANPVVAAKVKDVMDK